MRDITIYGKLPDSFKKEDGTRVTPEEWYTYKKELLEKIVDIEYGGMSPSPEVVKIEQLCDYKRSTGAWFRSGVLSFQTL